MLSHSVFPSPWSYPQLIDWSDFKTAFLKKKPWLLTSRGADIILLTYLFHL